MSELERRLDALIEKYSDTLGPTVFRLDVLVDLKWLKEADRWPPVSAEKR